MKNKELIKLLLDMELEKEIKLTKIGMAMELNKSDIKETEKKIEIMIY